MAEKYNHAAGKASARTRLPGRAVDLLNFGVSWA
jgi:hypothetical protein